MFFCVLLDLRPASVPCVSWSGCLDGCTSDCSGAVAVDVCSARALPATTCALCPYVCLCVSCGGPQFSNTIRKNTQIHILYRILFPTDSHRHGHSSSARLRCIGESARINNQRTENQSQRWMVPSLSNSQKCCVHWHVAR